MIEQSGAQLWPFLTGRARAAGHRDIVVPGFLAGTALAGELVTIVGTGVTPDKASPDEAFVQQLTGPPAGLAATGALCAVFRRYRPRKSDFGLGGEEPLLDGSSRRFAVTEGFIVESPVEDCLSAGLTIIDMEA